MIPPGGCLQRKALKRKEMTEALPIPQSSDVTASLQRGEPPTVLSPIVRGAGSRPHAPAPAPTGLCAPVVPAATPAASVPRRPPDVRRDASDVGRAAKDLEDLRPWPGPA